MAEEEKKVGDEAVQSTGDTARGINAVVDAPVNAYEGAKDAIETGKNAIETGKNVADASVKGAKKVAGATSKAANKIKNDGVKQTAKDVGNAAKNKINDNVNNAKQNIKDNADKAKKTANQIKNDGVKGNAQKLGKAAKNSSVKLAKTVKNKAKEAPKKAAKAAGNAAKNVLLNMLKSLKKKSIGVAAIGIALCVIIIANTPNMIINGLGLGAWHNTNSEVDYEAIYKSKVEEMKKINGDEDSDEDYDPVEVIKKFFRQHFSLGIADPETSQLAIPALYDWMCWKWSQLKDYFMDKNTEGEIVFKKAKGDVVVTEEELEELKQSETYEEVLSFYIEIIDYFMNQDYEAALDDIQAMAENNSDIDAELTMEKIRDQGDPFSAVNYASIIAAYSASTEWVEDSLARFKYKVKNGNFVTYETSEQTTEKIVPIELYKYELVQDQTVNAMNYYTAWGDGTEVVRDAVIYSYNHYISLLWDEILDMQASLEIATDEDDIEILNQAIADNNEIINEYRNKINALNNDVSLAKVEDIVYVENETIVVDLFKLVRDDDGNPVILKVIEKEEGEVAAFYKEFPDLEDMYIRTEISHLYKPEKVQVKYYEVLWQPIDTTNCLEWFEVDPEDIARSSLNEKDRIRLVNEEITEEELLDESPSVITMKQLYDEYYETLENKCASAQYSTGVSQAYGKVYTEAEIQKYLDDITRADPEISKNRLQVVKTALAMCGRIMYQWGGKYADAQKWGWNPKWSKTKTVGLDCSGYVQWVYRSALCEQKPGKNQGKTKDKGYKDIGFTGDVVNKCTRISIDNLKPGDLATRTNSTSGNGSNHVLIYLGEDKKGNLIFANSPRTGKPVSVTTKTKQCGYYYWRVKSDYIEKDNYYDEENVIPCWMPENEALAGRDEKQVICEVLRQESSVDAGFRACAEATKNFADSKKSTIYKALTNQIPSAPNYSEAYVHLYIDKTHKPAPIESKHYEMLSQVMNGEYEYFGPDQKLTSVKLWIQEGLRDTWHTQKNYVSTIGGNDFFKMK